MANNETANTTNDLSDQVLYLVNSIQALKANAEDIQKHSVKLLKMVKQLSKKEIIENDDLIRLFKMSFPGRANLIAWFRAFSPIRVTLEKNGHFKKISWAKNPKWDLELADKTWWWEFDGAKTSHKKAGNINAAIDGLARAVARIATERGDFELNAATIDATLKEAKQQVDDLLRQKVFEILAKDSHAEWMEGRKASIAMERAAMGSAEADEKKRREEKIAAIAAMRAAA